MPVKKLKDFLDKKRVKYVLISHSEAYTSQEIAATAHIPGKELAKTVIVKLDGEMAMVVLPASHQIDFDLCKKATGSDTVELASEEEFKYRFPDCEIGAMPPFGNLYDMDVYVAEKLTEDELIAFNACSHKELMRISYKDFKKLVDPRVIKVTPS
ncbi:MAG: deacylase [Caldithrix sp.]|nr:deacylase [Caldithrix sp.]